MAEDASKNPETAARAPDEASREPLDLGHFWTWANVLTLSRIVLVLPIAWLVYIDGPLWLLVLLILVAVATDYFDGKVARRSNTVSEWGKLLDPVADKFAALAVTIALVIRPVEPNLDLWFVLLVIIRDIVIAAGGVIQIRRVGFVMMALWSGKLAVNLLTATVVAVILRLPELVIDGLTFLTAFALLYSLGRYLHRYLQIRRYGPDVRLDEKHNVVRG